jgi:hypothetical protein
MCTTRPSTISPDCALKRTVATSFISGLLSLVIFRTPTYTARYVGRPCSRSCESSRKIARILSRGCWDSAKSELCWYQHPQPILSPHGASPQNLVNLRTYMPTLFKPISAVLCLVFALCFAAPNAHGDSFTPIFTCTGTCLAPLPTAPDMTFPASSITVTWDSNVFTLPVSTNPILENPNDIYSWEGDFGTVFPGNITFRINNLSIDLTVAQGFDCGSCTPAFTDMGVLTFTPVATPEPSSVALMLAGAGLVFGMRKRSTSGLRQAS